MSTYTHTTIETPVMFQLKGGLFPLTALQLQGTDFDLFEEQLTSKIQQAPKFFHNAPVVIDLQKIQLPGISVDFKRLIDILIRKRLIPVGVKGGLPEHMVAATQAGLPTLQDTSKENSSKAEQDAKNSAALHKATEAENEDDQAVQGSNTRIVMEPVRSGQQIYARGGDLIILAPVSHGSELLADGNIHVYGPLRGRALAGVTGDQSAHIFCHSLEAELVSIAGQYKISEDIDPTDWRTAVDISLAEGRLQIRQL